MNKLKDGEEYESYILNIIKDKYKNCYLWKDIPSNILDNRFYKNEIICDDIGCDIIGIKNDDTIDYIQCKNYSTTGIDNNISIYDLSGFYNFIAENSINNPIVYYSGKLSQQILCRQNKIKYINIPLIKNNKIIDFKARDYQLEAYNKLKEYNKSILSMPCGTGKTFVSFLLSLDYKNIFILTPLISTTEQILSHYKNYYSKYENINYILVNCNAERDINNIKLNENKNIIASTYDSSDVIWKILKTTYIDENLIIIDEFHNLSFDMITNKKNNIYKIMSSKSKTLFISATPLNVDNYKNIFGDSKYELSWKTAIEYKYICDYNFYYPNNDRILDKINDLKVDKSIIEKTILINKSYFLLDSIKLLGFKKCIVYLKTIDECNNFFKILQIINIYFELNIKVYEITYNTTKKKRIEILNKFKNDNTHINILCNVHILDEGIDIQECDSVYLTHPNNNPINIIQRISRANRIDRNNNNKIAKILVWSKNKIKLENIMNRINKTIDIKYGKEENDCINSNFKNNNVTINKDIIYINYNNDIKKYTNNNNMNINFKHSCKNCHKSFKYDYLLLKHYNRKNKCETKILKIDENKNNIDTYNCNVIVNINNTDNIIKKYICKICQKSFKYDYLLLKHYNRENKCKSTIDKNIKNNDNKNIDDKDYKDIINKIKNYEKKITIMYKKSIHNEQKCNFCDKKFGIKGNLKRHLDLYCDKRKTLIAEKDKLLYAKQIYEQYNTNLINNKSINHK
jgi:superfamily II DNA or RNA helicase